jgi:hypothetical protein
MGKEELISPRRGRFGVGPADLDISFSLGTPPPLLRSRLHDKISAHPGRKRGVSPRPRTNRLPDPGAELNGPAFEL